MQSVIDTQFPDIFNGRTFNGNIYVEARSTC